MEGIGAFHGEEQGAVTYVPGRVGHALDLGASGYPHIRVASDSTDPFVPGTLDPESLSLAFWFRRDPARATGTNEMIIEKGRPCFHHYGCALWGTDLTCSINANTNTCSSIRSVMTVTDPAVWQHVVFTAERDAGGTGMHLRLYVNGTLVSQFDDVGAYPNNNHDLRAYFVLGRNYYTLDGVDLTSVQNFPGQIDSVLLYRGVLSASEVAALFSSY